MTGLSQGTQGFCTCSLAVADCTDANEDRSRWMTFQCAALAFGATMGPLLASYASEYLSETAPVMIAAAQFIVLAPVLAVTLPETLPKTLHSGNDEECMFCCA